MHELSLAEALRDVVLDSAALHRATRVTQVCCRVGVLRQIVPHLFEEAFALCAAGTIAEGARLILEAEVMEARCPACYQRVATETALERCPACGSGEIVLSGGQDLLLAAMEIEQESNHAGLGAA
jgi:hydrogenase nickel incorporation protein HypA/HybF